MKVTSGHSAKSASVRCQESARPPSSHSHKIRGFEWQTAQKGVKKNRCEVWNELLKRGKRRGLQTCTTCTGTTTVREIEKLLREEEKWRLPTEGDYPMIFTYHKQWQGDPDPSTWCWSWEWSVGNSKQFGLHWWKALVHDGERNLLKISAAHWLGGGGGHLSSEVC